MGTLRFHTCAVLCVLIPAGLSYSFTKKGAYSGAALPLSHHCCMYVTSVAAYGSLFHLMVYGKSEPHYQVLPYSLF